MANIWNYVQFTDSERPKYTRYELAKMVLEKRNQLGLKTEELAEKVGIEPRLLTSIEVASRSFNVLMYKAISKILDMTTDELVMKDKDNLASISFRTNDLNSEIEETVKIANLLFDEMVMQEKIGVR
ncbi:helix-turn-helix domain-containing protein [Schinkia sp. CFF1]